MKRQRAIAASIAGFRPELFPFPAGGTARIQKLIIARQLPAADVEG
jgi:hypothetical protein